MISKGLSKASAWRLWMPRVLAAAVGLVLLTAGVLKATDMELFIRQIRDYGIISQRVLLALSAWGIIAVECALGVGLLVFYRPRLVLSSTAMLLLIFLGGTGWAWLTGATEECGCYGIWFKYTPAEAVLENFILLSATVAAWAGRGHLQTSHTRAKAWAVSAACLIGFALPVAFGFPISGINRPPSEALQLEFGSLQIQGLDHVDLTHGTYLIILTDTECHHCQEVVPQVNILAETAALHGVIALCTNEESQRMEFAQEFQANFPIGQITEDDFWRLLGHGDIPRFVLVCDGSVRQMWDQEAPDKDMIEAALSG